MNKKKVDKYLKESIDLTTDQQMAKEDDEWRAKFVNHFEDFPKRLYKYAKLNRFTFDAIKRNYIYLCPADKLDDQFECNINDITLKRFKNAKSEQDVFLSIMDILQDVLQDYPLPMSPEMIIAAIKEKYKQKTNISTVSSIANLMGHDLTKEEKEASEKIEKENLGDKGGEMVKYLYSQVNDFRKNKGIGSLTEVKSSQVMWEMYANHYKGICIEYDLFDDSEIFLETFPVKYSKKREDDLFRISLGIVMDNYVSAMSGGAFKPTKNMEKLSQIAKEQGIKLYRQYDDEKTLQIKYKPID